MKRFLVQVEVKLIKNLVVSADSADDAVEIASAMSVESLALGENGTDHEVVVLGDEPAGHGSGGVYLLAEEGTPEWEQEFKIGGAYESAAV